MGEVEGYRDIGREFWIKHRNSLRPFHSRELDLRRKITRFSLEVGLIPGTCPVCKNRLPGGMLEEHHWGTVKGDRGQDEAFRLGKIRRICKSCNQVLGRLQDTYGKGYWVERFREHNRRLYDSDYTWEEQFGLLSEYFRSERKIRLYPNFDGVEEEWSRFLPIEEYVYRRIIGRSSYGKEEG